MIQALAFLVAFVLITLGLLTVVFGMYLWADEWRYRQRASIRRQVVKEGWDR